VRARDAGPDEPLFLDRDDKRLGVTAASELFARICRHAGKGKRLGSHSFRKFFTTTLESAGMPLNFLKKFQGKSIGGAMAPYSKPEELGLLTPAYIQHYDALRVFGSPESVKPAEFEELKAKIKDQEAELAEYRRRMRAVEDALKEKVRMREKFREG
jgi:hypothetical protein